MPDRKIDSVVRFLQQELTADHNASQVFVFRGHDKPAPKLQPTVYRSENLERHEDKLMSELMMQSPHEFAEDTLAFERLVRARHYGLPTRLLDVTMNPLVALFFACKQSLQNSGSEAEVDGELIRFGISHTRTKVFDSDAVSLVSNLSRLQHEEKEAIRGWYKGIVKTSRKFSDLGPTDIEKLRKLLEIDRLLQFVRVEKPYFRNEVSPPDLWQFMLIHPKKNNRRIVAQSGAFIASGLLAVLRDDVSKDFSIERFQIPFEHKKTIRMQLDRLNINLGTMFPELEHAANYVKEKYG